MRSPASFFLRPGFLLAGHPFVPSLSNGVPACPPNPRTLSFIGRCYVYSWTSGCCLEFRFPFTVLFSAPPVPDFTVLGFRLVVKATMDTIGNPVLVIACPAHRAGYDSLATVGTGLHVQLGIQLHFLIAVGAYFPAFIFWYHISWSY